MKKRYELLIVLIVIAMIIGLGLWRAVSISIPHPSLLHSVPPQTFVPLNPPIYSTTTPATSTHSTSSGQATSTI